MNAMYCSDATTTTTTAATTTVTTAGPATTSGACTDSFTFCRRIRRFCETEDYVDEMAVACRKSCKICVSCEDKSRFEDRCPAWADAGYCTGRYERFMTRNCKKSCDLC